MRNFAAAAVVEADGETKGDGAGGGGGGRCEGPVDDIAVLRVRTRWGGSRRCAGPEGIGVAEEEEEEVSCSNVTDVKAVVLVANAGRWTAFSVCMDDAHDARLFRPVSSNDRTEASGEGGGGEVPGSSSSSPTRRRLSKASEGVVPERMVGTTPAAVGQTAPLLFAFRLVPFVVGKSDDGEERGRQAGITEGERQTPNPLSPHPPGGGTPRVPSCRPWLAATTRPCGLFRWG